MLLSVRAPVGSTNLSKEKCCIGRGLAAIRPIDRDMNIKFCIHFFRFIEKDLNNLGTGTTFKAISGKQIRELKIPLPPLSEQKRIVSKIESIFSQIDAGKERLEKVRVLLKQCRQSTLKDAFEIKANFEINELDNLILFSKNGFTGRPNKNNQGIPRLGIETITGSNSIFVNEVKHKFIDISLSKQMIYAAKKGDLFFCRQNGNKNNVGKCKLFQGIIKPMIFSDSLIQFRVNNNKIIPEYLVYFVNSVLGRSQIEQYCSTTAGNFSINGTNLKKIQIKYPSLSEQNQIIFKIESIFGRIDAIENSIILTTYVILCIKFTIHLILFVTILYHEFYNTEKNIHRYHNQRQN